MADNPWVGIVMGSKNDWDQMKAAAEMLDALGVSYEARALSAHRTPEAAGEYARTAEERGLKVIIAGAGGAAHLAGAMVANSILPILGVPIDATPLAGFDALLATVQMPKGVPVGTLAVGKMGAANAGILAATIIGVGDEKVRENLREWRRKRAEQVLADSKLA